MNKPLLAVTMGDPAGVGAEIVVKTFANPKVFELAQPFVIGSAKCLERAARQTETHVSIDCVDSVSDVKYMNCIQVLEPIDLDMLSFTIGKVSPKCGHAAVQYFETAVRLCQAEAVQGVVTCPINKEAVHAAGYHGDIGHQEILARMTQAELTATMLMTKGLKVAHLSTHKSLADAVEYIKTPILVEKIKLTVDSLKRWGVNSPCVAVAALNPHGGEGGMLGREEIEEITPAVTTACEMGMNVVGPYPADSVFYRATSGEFDAVLALYHDQGHIAIKMHNFSESITATMGIPFGRTSVDHGTAFDIAGKNISDANGLKKALEVAIAMIDGSLK